jgi:hypothetical protein
MLELRNAMDSHNPQLAAGTTPANTDAKLTPEQQAKFNKMMGK